MALFLRSYLLILVFVALLPLGGLMSCGGSALPQTSLPLPENDDPITVSSPNSAGFVVVTGSTDAVPDSSTIVITVTDTATSFNFKNLSDKLIKSAAASTCSSDLPQCPELSDGDQCQFDANADGSFTLLVPASLDNEILVSYLDTSSCEQVDAYTKVVATGIVAIDLDITGAVSRSDLDLVYLFGSTADGAAVLNGYNTLTEEVIEYPLDTGSDLPVALSAFSSSSGDYYLVIQTMSKTIIGPVADDGSIDLANFVSLVDSSGTDRAGLKFYQARTETFSSYNTCVSSTLFEPADSQQFTRLFFSQEDTLYILDFEDNYLDVDPAYINSSGNLVPRSIQLDKDIIFDDTTELNGLDISEIHMVDDTMDKPTLLVSLIDGDQTHYEIVRLVNYNSFCQSSINLANVNSGDLYLGTVAGDLYYKTYSAYADDLVTGVLEETVHFVMLKRDEKVMLYIDMGGDAVACNLNNMIYLSTTPATEDDSNCAQTTDGNSFTVSADQDLANVALIFPMINENHMTEYFVLGQKNAGSTVVAGFAGSVLATDAVVSVIDPAMIAYSSLDNQLTIIDRGVMADGVSNYLTYDLAGELLLY